MIPGPLVAPAPTARLGPPKIATALRVLAVVMVLAAVCGALAWTLVLSPLSLSRWNLFDSTLEYHITAPGTYVIYEEGPGEASRIGPPMALVSVRSLSGRKVVTESRIDDTGRSSTTYRTPWHEGRALASFTADHAGTYELFAFPTAEASTGSTTNAAGTPGQFIDLSKLPVVAVGPEGVPAGLGTVPGLALVTAAPLSVALGLFGFASWRWPSSLRRAGTPRRARRRGGAGDEPVPMGLR